MKRFIAFTVFLILLLGLVGCGGGVTVGGFSSKYIDSDVYDEAVQQFMTELDPDEPYQSAQVNLEEPETYTFAAAPEEGNVFVKWTKNGEDYSTEPVITVLLEESADFVAVFEEGHN